MSDCDPSHGAVVRVLLDRHGATFSSEAGIRLDRDTPSALFRLLCLSLLISARISGTIAMRAARALADEGWTTPDKMAESTWEQRTRTLNRAGYARYDESTARYLDATTRTLIESYSGDLRGLREEAHGDAEATRRALEKFEGIGDVGASFFVREVQAVWTELDPYIDERVIDSAEDLGLPTTATGLRKLADDSRSFADLVAAIVRSALADDQDEILDEAGRATVHQ